MIGGAAAILLTAFQVLYTNSSMVALGKSFDFMPLNAALKERDLYQSYATMHMVAEVLKLLITSTLAVRLLIDRYGWKTKFLPSSPKRIDRKRRSPTSSRSKAGLAGAAAAGTTPAEGEVAVESDVVNKADDGHVNG